MRLGNAIAIVLMLLGQTETVQLFIGDDGCYGDGTRWVVREAVNECEHGNGGWGPVKMECYSDGALYYRCGVAVTFDCAEVRPTPDLDQDGDVDLEDINAALAAMTGPQGMRNVE